MACDYLMTMAKKELDTLCWKCAKAVPDLSGNGCSWSRDFVPVEGWKARTVLRKVRDADRIVEEINYSVISCPEFREG